MDLLVLGGTVFVSRAVAAAAVARGHRVTCAARGLSGTVPDGAEHVRLDRDTPDWSALDRDWDAVVDVARTPSRVDAALSALTDRTAHWTFVSTVNVYADEQTPGGRPGTLPLREPLDDEDVPEDSSTYGAHKVRCEQSVRARAAAAFVVRPGLVVGPGDPTGRYSYWPERLSRPGPVLAPHGPDRRTQLVDVRDLAAWIVDAAEQRLTGDYDAVCPPTPLGELLAATARGVGVVDPDLVWVPQDDLDRLGVQPWAGPGSLPLFLPHPTYAGLTEHDVSPSLAAGLRTRPLEETAADTLAWLVAHPEAATAARTGLDADAERAVLAAWSGR